MCFVANFLENEQAYKRAIQVLNFGEELSFDHTFKVAAILAICVMTRNGYASITVSFWSSMGMEILYHGNLPRELDFIM